MADFLGHLSRVSGDPIPILPEATEQTGSARRKLQGKTVSPRPHLSPQFTDEETEPQRGQVAQSWDKWDSLSALGSGLGWWQLTWMDLRGRQKMQ